MQRPFSKELDLAMQKKEWLDLREKHWQMLKEQYPIGCKFWGKVWKTEPFGILVESDNFPKESYKNAIGAIDVGHHLFFKEDAYSWVHQEGCKELPRDSDFWPSKGSYIYCIVCYYRDHGDDGQLGLAWLGEVSETHPNETN